MKIMVLLGTVRDGRLGEKVANWVMPQLNEFAEEKADCTFELVDLKDIDLPLLKEPYPPAMGQPYAYDHTKEWSAVVQSYDAVIFLCAEYNYSIPAALKNAIDSLGLEWKEKPVACIGYGGGGGKRSINHLQSVFEILAMKPVDYTVHVNNHFEAFNEDGSMKDGHLEGSVTELAQKLYESV